MTTKDNTPVPCIVIIGGGASGSLTALQLLRTATTPLQIHLIERDNVLGRGIAYSTSEESALLNVPAGKMSLFPDDAGHFMRWLGAVGFRDEVNHPATALSFVPRSVYGRYISDTLAEAEQAASPAVRLIRHQDTVTDIAPSGDSAWVSLQSGQQIHADQVVLAFGHFPPRNLPILPPSVRTSPRYHANPWDAELFDAISPDESVLIIGTGLTMVDVALGLQARGHRGPIHAVSKRGLHPQPHALLPAPHPNPAPLLADFPTSARSLVRFIRRYIAHHAQSEGMNWQTAFDTLRPLTVAVWKKLPITEKRRLLRHAVPYWDIHRHRMPPVAAALMDILIAKGQLTLQAGFFRQISLTQTGIRATIETRHGQTLTLEAQHLINCTGPNTDYTTLNAPLLSNLIRRDLIQPDGLRLGLDATPDGHLFDTTGAESRWLYAIGPLLKGILWETTAIPEIRQQAAILANQLLSAVEEQAQVIP